MNILDEGTQKDEEDNSTMDEVKEDVIDYVNEGYLQYPLDHDNCTEELVNFTFFDSLMETRLSLLHVFSFCCFSL